MSKLLEALVGRALRLQEQTSLESLAIELDDWYRREAAEYVALPDWGDGYIPPDALAERTMPEGWREVGQGHFSLAVAHVLRPDYVFKICCRAGDAYPEYAAWCVSKFNDGTHVNLCVPHIPFLHHSLDHVRIVPVQRLEKINSQYTGNSEEYCRELEVYVNAIDTYMRDLIGITAYQDIDQDMVSDKMKATLQALAKAFRGLRSVDIHSGNVMLDASGEMVLTDPLGFASSTGTWRRQKRRKH